MPARVRPGADVPVLAEGTFHGTPSKEYGMGWYKFRLFPKVQELRDHSRPPHSAMASLHIPVNPASSLAECAVPKDLLGHLQFVVKVRAMPEQWSLVTTENR